VPSTVVHAAKFVTNKRRTKYAAMSNYGLPKSVTHRYFPSGPETWLSEVSETCRRPPVRLRGAALGTVG
jgi:hypothetical protein